MSESFPEPKPNEASPAKNRWVQFDNDDDVKSPRSGKGSGVTSVRGSATSSDQNSQKKETPGSLPVTSVETVNESQLRKKASLQNPSNTNKALSMDNVNLSETDISPNKQTNINVSSIRGKQFQNGEVIVTLLPVNEMLPWITPAKFRPELVPEELMAPVLTLTVEEYVQTMEKLTTDMRFTIFNMSYKRILALWILVAFIILLAFLFSFTKVELFACGVGWLVLNAFAIFFCMWIKLKLNKHLEKCMASINTSLLKHNLILGVDDRGKLSCHKVNLCFIYFNPSECIKKLESILAETTPTEPGSFNRETYLRDEEEFEDVEVVISGRNSVKLDQKKDRAEKLFLHYLQRWSKDYLRRRLDWVVDDMYGRTEYLSTGTPRHLRSALCPCQYIEEHLRNKRSRESLNPCKLSWNPCHWCQ